jgi:glutamate--cysteine ligase
MEPVRDAAQLELHFARGCKPAAEHHVGVEHEKIAVIAGSDRAPDYPATVGPLLDRLAEGGDWSPIVEAGVVIGLKRGRATVSLEPGGQVELSDEPRANAADAAKALAAHLAELAPAARAQGVEFLATGFRPFGTLDDVPWMPKGRYRVMREYLPTRGRLAHEMMKRTATVQANLDYADQADCAEKMRVGMGVSSLVTALWAASPIVEGRATDEQSHRAAMWLETDPDRCGLLPFVFEPRAEERLFADYTSWALDVPMFFVHRGGTYTPVGGMTFRRYLAEGFQGQPATAGDWEVHLSTLFPEARLKQYLEVRGADAGAPDMVAALPALWRGLLYHPEARQAAWKLVKDWTMVEREALRREVPRAGFRARVGGREILEPCRELVAIAREGLLCLGDDQPDLLGPVEEIAASGVTRADQLRDLAGRGRDALRAALTIPLG